MRSILGNLRYQTVRPDETLVFCSDTEDVARFREEFPEAQFFERPNREDWGHEKRAEGLEKATGDFVGFFNDDDSYELNYLEKMLRYPDADAVYCSWNTYPDCTFHGRSSTSGNFIVRRELAQKIGYQHRHYEADGEFIEAINVSGAAVFRVGELLYRHNSQ